MPSLRMAEAVAQSGLSIEVIKDLARMLVTRRKTLVITQDANPAVAALNVVLGSVGIQGGIVRSSKNNAPVIAAEQNISNARALLIDASVPGNFVPRTDAEVFRFAAWDDGSNTADWLLPAPGFLEETNDVPTAPGSAVETYAIATSLVRATCDVRSAARFLADVDSSAVPAEKIIPQRCRNLYQKRLGFVHGLDVIPLSKFASAEKFEEALRGGGVWIGETPTASLRCALKEWPSSAPASEIENWASRWSVPVLPTLASKLYLESTLRESPRRNA